MIGNFVLFLIILTYPIKKGFYNMRKFFTLIFSAFFSLFIFSQNAMALNVDAFMDKHVAPVSDFIAGIIFYQISFFGQKVPLIIFWILFAGIFFTIYFKGIAVWGFKHAIDTVSKPAEKTSNGCGEVSSFQAFVSFYQVNQMLLLLLKYVLSLIM